MKNLKLILMVALVVMFSSIKAFAGSDYLGDLGKQVSSGISGLQRGDWGGVASGIGSFATTTITTAPVLSQVYGLGQAVGGAAFGAGQWTGQQLSNLGSTYSSLGLGTKLNFSATGLGTGFNSLSTQASQLRALVNPAGTNSKITAGAKIDKAPGAGYAVPRPTSARVEALKTAVRTAGVNQPLDRSWYKH
jgi:hypothetical protein